MKEQLIKTVDADEKKIILIFMLLFYHSRGLAFNQLKELPQGIFANNTQLKTLYVRMAVDI